MRLPRNATLVSAQALDDWYRSLLPPTAANSTEPRILYTYSAAMTGFAARLTEEELRSVERKPGFLASFRDRQVGKIRDVDLNYPTITVALSSDFDQITVTCIVKNVCSEKSTYKLKVDSLESVVLEVSPETLDFAGKINESKSFNISFIRTIAHPPTHEEGHLLWVSNTKSVRIPILMLV
ncbi:hypothetical protein ZIOFF_065452 [Zingiber officinale]|uniref:Inhibitor I9 domain-containing protein n=1 Tax=Zingiber officinale TaxID=94328 RepID=A0A8J5EX54_ZINOF|nr:hypothetical protein ZIOFF_065452 [Zingiber officinale]